jgi:glycosyltransferase involved in cell wall biosynthesis
VPLLSVIVTAYNIEDYLAECLETVVSQTLTDMEIIVVDDGSDDGTPEIIRDFATRDARVKPVFLPENTIGGVASAANAGLELAEGSYVGFVDGDDYLDPTMFEELCAAVMACGSELAMCRYKEVVGPEKTLRDPAERRRWVRYKETRCVALDRDDNTISILRFIAVPWRKIYARRLLEENAIRFPVVDYFWEDNPFHWFTVCSANAIAVVPKVLCYHRVGRPGQTMDTRNAELLRMFGHYRTIRDWLDARGLLKRYHPPLLGWAISQYQWIHRRIPREAGGALYDALAGILGPVDQAVFDRALREKRAGTRKQMRAVRAGDREAFMKGFDRQFDKSAGGGDGRIGGALSVVRLFAVYVRTKGLWPTLGKTARVLRSDRFFGRLFHRRNKAVSEETMLKYMTLLQRDMDRKHAEQLARLEAIERVLRERPAPRDET